MCVIIFVLNPNDRYKLVLISNREESYDRPTEIAHYWPDKKIIAGRDLKDGGTQIAMGINGKISMVTNLNTESINLDTKSRGLLVSNYHSDEVNMETYGDTIVDSDYKPYNLIYGLVNSSVTKLFYSQFLGDKNIPILSCKIYTLENSHLFDIVDRTETSKPIFQRIIAESKSKMELIHTLFILLSEEPIVKISSQYRTRCQTVILIDHANTITFVERNLLLQSLEQPIYPIPEGILHTQGTVKNNTGTWIENYYTWTI